MSVADPSVHLKRAYGLVKAVEESTGDLRQAALRYQESASDNQQPFITGMLSTIKGGRDDGDPGHVYVILDSTKAGAIECGVMLIPQPDETSVCGAPFSTYPVDRSQVDPIALQAVDGFLPDLKKINGAPVTAVDYSIVKPPAVIRREGAAPRGGAAPEPHSRKHPLLPAVAPPRRGPARRRRRGSGI